MEAPDRRARLSPAVLVAAACAGLVLAVGALSPLLRIPWPPLLFMAAFAAVTAETLVTAAVAPVLGWKRLVPAVVLPLAALGGLAWVAESLPPLLQATVVTMALLVAGSSVGGAVGGRIEHAGHLLPVVVVSLLVDSFSVFHSAGPTSAIVERPALIAVLALPWPVLGTAEVAPVLGVGDVVFAALYVTAARRFGLGVRRTLLALAVGLLLTMVVVLLSGQAIPALVGMGVAVLVAHPRARKIPPADRRKAWIVMAVVAATLVVLLLRDRTDWF